MKGRSIAAGIVLLGAAGAAYAAARSAERRVVRAALQATAAAGLEVRHARFSWLGPLSLEGVAFRPDATTRVAIEAVEVDWRLAGGAEPRAHVARLRPRGLTVRRGAWTFHLGEATFAVLAWEAGGGTERVRLRQLPQGGTFSLDLSRAAQARQVDVAVADLDLSAARLRWAGEPVLEPGRWTGRGTARAAAGRTALEGALSWRGARASLGRLLGEDGGGPGEPTDGELTWSARRERDAVEIESARVRLAGVSFDVRGRFDGRAAAPRVEAEVKAEAELGGALRAAGLRLPDAIEVDETAGLGTAWFEVSVRGPLGDAAALRVTPRLRFEPAPAAVDALAYLRRPFRHRPRAAGTRIEVSAGAPDFVAMAEVPPLFVRMLLTAEDAGFFGHPGIDVAEIPVAWAANAERGGFARGASTITQQLARNLFLSPEKSYGRKLEEAALALMMDAAVPKPRILEIYLNVIEWGPGLYGLRPAARHYFGKDPSQLTAKEMAFLVCLVPSPVRYHSAHRAGHVGPGMEQLMQNLLAKLHSSTVLTDEEYARARDEVLAFLPEDAAGPGRTEG
jgi:hypothetical protein